MSTEDRLWVKAIKQSQGAHSDFLQWLAEEREKVHNQYKTTTIEKLSILQAEEKVLDKLHLIFSMYDREDRQRLGQLSLKR